MQPSASPMRVSLVKMWARLSIGQFMRRLSLGEYRKAAQRCGTAGAHHRVRQNAVVEGDVDTVVIPVKGDRLHIDVGVQKLRAAYPHVGGVVERLLGTGGEIDPQVFHAVLIPAGVGYLPCVNGHGLTQILRIAAQDVRTLLRHGNPS